MSVSVSVGLRLSELHAYGHANVRAISCLHSEDMGSVDAHISLEFEESALSTFQGREDVMDEIDTRIMSVQVNPFVHAPAAGGVKGGFESEHIDAGTWLIQILQSKTIQWLLSIPLFCRAFVRTRKEVMSIL